MNMFSDLRSLLVAVGAVLFVLPLHAGAQSDLGPGLVPDARPPVTQGDRANGLSAELMYRLLVGDIALQRGEPGVAARAYFEAARDSRDARLARRATEIALAARQRGLAL